MKKILKIYIDAYSGLSKESWMLAIVMLLNRTGSMVLPFLGIYMTSKLNFSLEESGLVLSFYGIGCVFGSWLGGWLTDRIGNFKVQAFSLVVSAPMFLLLPHFVSIWGLATMIMVLSTVSEMFRPANSVAITKYARKENITRAFSLNRMAVNLGFSIGPAMGGFLADYSYNLLFYGNAIAAIIAGVVFIQFFYKRKERNVYTEEELEKNRSSVPERNAYLDWRFHAFNLFCVFFSIAFFQILNTLPLFYQDVAQMSRKEIGLIMGYSGLCIFLFEMLLVHWTEKKFTVTQILCYGSMVTGLSFVIFAFNHTLGFLYLAISLMSIGEMLVLPLMSTVTAMRAGMNNRGAYMGLNGLSAAIAFIVSPYLGTKIAGDYSFEALWLGTAVLLFASAIGFQFTVKALIPKES